MIAEAQMRLHDGIFLAERQGIESDSGYLLKLLALEIYLKILVEFYNPPSQKVHKLDQLFEALPESIKSRIFDHACSRVYPSALNDNMTKILCELGNNFVSLRYPYDKYSNLDNRQYSDLSTDWMLKGMPEEEAMFRYYPEELLGLLDAVSQITENEIVPHIHLHTES